MFCDLFAQYLSGYANIISVIDRSMAKERPTQGDDSDYPPNAMHVRVCALALTANQATKPTGQF